MTVGENRELALAMLTRSDMPRRGVGLPKSDEDLVRFLAGDIDSATLDCLIAVSKLLRLIDGLLGGKQTGESFVEKFSSHWLAVSRDPDDATCALMLEELHRLYEDIQLFCGSAQHRTEESLLFGGPRLQELVINAYDSVMRLWRARLIQPAAAPQIRGALRD